MSVPGQWDVAHEEQASEEQAQMADRKQTEASAPEDRARAQYEVAESRTARAFEELVSKPSFGVLLARSAENVAALTKISSDLADMVLRNLRIAGRADITRLARQLHRTEDKLERVLQEVEQLRDALGRGDADDASANGRDPKSRERTSTKR